MAKDAKVHETWWLGLLGNDDGDVVLTMHSPDKARLFELSPNQLRWLYEQLGAFCK